MDTLTGEVIVVLMATLGLGSSIIHYAAFAKSSAKQKAQVQIRKEKID